MVATYIYTPYGGLISGGDAGMGYTNRVRYAGGEYDRRTGYTHFGQRFYDPTTTKFTQQDPITKLANPQNGNTYQYAAANPCNNTDPTGRGDTSCLLAGFAAITAVVVVFLAPPVGIAAIIGAAIGITVPEAISFYECREYIFDATP